MLVTDPNRVGFQTGLGGDAVHFDLPYDTVCGECVTICPLRDSCFSFSTLVSDISTSDKNDAYGCGPRAFSNVASNASIAKLAN